MKDSENPFAKAQREEKEAKQRLEQRKRRKSPSPPQDDSTADKAKAVAELEGRLTAKHTEAVAALQEQHERQEQQAEWKAAEL